jgi:hypothetical protein
MITIRLVAIFILLGFVLPGVTLPFVGLSTYLSMESLDLQPQSTRPYAALVVAQILALLFAGIVVFLGLTHGREFGFPVGFSFVLCAFIVLFVLWMIAFFTSDAFEKVEPVLSLDQYQNFVEEMRWGLPGVIVEVTTHDCSTHTLVITGVSSTDVTDFPNASAVLDLVPLFVFRPVVHVHWDAESLDLLKESTEVIKRCRGDPFEYVNVTQTGTVVGWKERTFITRDGELPRSIRRGTAIAAGIFASWLYYMFSVDAIPIVWAHVIKNDARINTSVTSCIGLDWTCV